jgi:hypothetical protein
MIIQPIVEGPGDEKAVPVLIRRMFSEIIGCVNPKVLRPYKLDRSQMVKEDRCKNHLTISQLDPSVDHVILFLDADDDCCKEIHHLITSWSRSTVYRTSFDIICIEKEFECWLLAGIESLRGIRSIALNASPPLNINQIRGAKARISGFMPDGISYSETTDQAALTAKVSFDRITETCPSFNRLLAKLTAFHDGRCGCNLSV